MKLGLYLISSTKTNPGEIKNLEVKKQNFKMLEENIGEYLFHIGIGKNFLNITKNKQTIFKKVFIALTIVVGRIL